MTKTLNELLHEAIVGRKFVIDDGVMYPHLNGKVYEVLGIKEDDDGRVILEIKSDDHIKKDFNYLRYVSILVEE